MKKSPSSRPARSRCSSLRSFSLPGPRRPRGPRQSRRRSGRRSPESSSGSTSSRTTRAAAEKYYGGLFGWTFEPLAGRENPYKVIREKGQPIGGIVDMSARKSDLPESTWLGYVSVPDVDAAAAAFKEKGGKVLKEPLDVAGLARAAVVTDPQGALLGLDQHRERRSSGRSARRGPLPLDRSTWRRTRPAAMAFYRDVLGYEAKPLDAGVRASTSRTSLLAKGGKNRAGLYLTPWKDLNSNWLPYVRVADAARGRGEGEVARRPGRPRAARGRPRRQPRDRRRPHGRGARAPEVPVREERKVTRRMR